MSVYYLITRVILFETQCINFFLNSFQGPNQYDSFQHEWQNLSPDECVTPQHCRQYDIIHNKYNCKCVDPYQMEVDESLEFVEVQLAEVEVHGHEKADSKDVVDINPSREEIEQIL